MNRHLTISIVICGVFVTPGCRSVRTPPPIVALPGTSAPVIPLQVASYSKPTQIDVDFDDQRPDFERLYYPGTCEPRRWHDAMSVVPMEAFAPSIADDLRQRVADSTQASDPTTARAVVILTSFQFALDDREDIQSQYYAEYVNWEAKREEEDESREERRAAASRERMRDKPDYESFGSSETENSIGSKLMGEAVVFGFNSLFIDLPRKGLRKESVRKRTTAEPQTLPIAITEGKQTGLNCQIHATIIFSHRDGTQVQQSVRINRHARLTDISSTKQQTAALLEASLEEFSASL